MSRARAMSAGPARLAASELAPGLEAFGDDLVGCFALEDALAAGIVGGVEATQQLLELLMGVDGDAQHLAADPAIEAFDQPFV